MRIAKDAWRMADGKVMRRIIHTLCTIGCLLPLAGCGATNNKPAPVIRYGVQGGASSAGVHTVASGDTLWNIAQRYHVDMKDVVYVNHLRAPYFLQVGDRLNLPPTRFMIFRAPSPPA